MEEPFLYNWYSNDFHIHEGQDGRKASLPIRQTDESRQDGRIDMGRGMKYIMLRKEEEVWQSMESVPMG